MSVIVFAQDLSSRRDDGHYSKPDLASALGIFFGNPAAANFMDSGGQDELAREDAEAIFQQDGRVIFFNEDGEKVVIASDPTA